MFDFKKNKIRSHRLGIALGGGGARGLVHIAFLKVLADLDITPVIVSGTSIGALIGAIYCSGISPYEIEKRHKSMTLLDWGRLIDLAIPAVHGLVKGDKIIKYLNKEYNLTKFEKLQIPLKIVATDFWNKEEVVFQDGDLLQAIRASISIPGVFEPISFNDRILTDGGAANPVPYDIIRNDCDLLVAIDVTGNFSPDRDASDLPYIFDCIVNSFQIMESVILDNKLAKSSPDLLYQPDIMNISLRDFYKYDDIIKQSRPEIDRFREDMIKFKASHK
jgi:NTE family protein